MERAQRLTTFWNWLPVFRAVAETQHLPTASSLLHLTPSTLSRTIRVLEEDVGRTLFDRVGRQLELNAAGRVMLGAVRDAMRLVDEALATVSGGQLMGTVHVAVSGPFAPSFVLPAFEALAEEHPELLPHVRAASAPSLNGMLLKGQLDLAVTDDVVPHEELAVSALGTITHGVYCSSEHPLHGASPDVDEVLTHRFVTPPLDDRGRPVDAWPRELRRKVGLRVDQMQVAVDACATGRYLAALPDLVGQRSSLHRLPFTELPATTLYLVHRESLALQGKTEVTAAAIRAAVEAVLDDDDAPRG